MLQDASKKRTERAKEAKEKNRGQQKRKREGKEGSRQKRGQVLNLVFVRSIEFSNQGSFNV